MGKENTINICVSGAKARDQCLFRATWLFVSQELFSDDLVMIALTSVPYNAKAPDVMVWSLQINKTRF